MGITLAFERSGLCALLYSQLVRLRLIVKFENGSVLLAQANMSLWQQILVVVSVCFPREA